MYIRINLVRDSIWTLTSLLLTYAAGAISGMVTGEKMSSTSIWYSAVFTAFIQLGYRVFFGDLQFIIIIVATNIALFFILPLWWEPEDKTKKVYCYIMFLMFNTILGLALYWIIKLVS